MTTITSTYTTDYTDRWIYDNDSISMHLVGTSGTIPDDWSHVTVTGFSFTASNFASNGSGYSGTIRFYFSDCNWSSEYWYRTTFGGGGETISMSGNLDIATWGQRVASGMMMYVLAKGTSGKKLVYINGTGTVNFTLTYTDNTTNTTPPSSVSLNTSTGTMSIVGGAGGTYNTFAGYLWSYCERTTGTTEFGSWSAETTKTASAPGTAGSPVTVSVTCPSGKDRKFRVRTLGSAGAAFAGTWTECPTIWTSNSGTSVPQILHPAEDSTVMSSNPVIRLHLDADPEGQSMTLYMKVDGGSKITIQSEITTAIDKNVQVNSLAAGAHSLQFYAKDSGGATGTTTTLNITVDVPTYARAISTGSVISNSTISHKAEMEQLIALANRQRILFGLSAKSYTGVCGRWKDWKSIMEQLQDSIDDCRAAVSLSAITWTAVPSYPKAAVVNEIRTHLTDI